MNGIKWTVTSILILTISAAFAAACSGSDDGDSGDSSTSCSAEEAAQVPETVFKQTCAGGICHDLNPDDKFTSTAELDLIAPGVESRVKDQLSKDCANKVFVDSSAPESSYLLEKVTQENPTCGDHMPSGGQELTAKQMACLKAWVSQVAAK